MICVEKIFAQAIVLEQDLELVNGSVKIGKTSIIDTGSIQPRSLMRKLEWLNSKKMVNL